MNNADMTIILHSHASYDAWYEVRDATLPFTINQLKAAKATRRQLLLNDEPVVVDGITPFTKPNEGYVVHLTQAVDGLLKRALRARGFSVEYDASTKGCRRIWITKGASLSAVVTRLDPEVRLEDVDLKDATLTDMRTVLSASRLLDQETDRVTESLEVAEIASPYAPKVFAEKKKKVFAHDAALQWVLDQVAGESNVAAAHD
jgi:hypothetical protein